MNDWDKLPIVEQVYHTLNEHNKRIGECVWGSVAFDIETGKTRGQINKLISKSKLSQLDQIIEEVEKMKVASRDSDDYDLGWDSGYNQALHVVVSHLQQLKQSEGGKE